jgi:hypothetical protein
MNRLQCYAMAACLALSANYVLAETNTCFVAKITAQGQDDINKNFTVKETGSDTALRFNVDFPMLSALMTGSAWSLPDNTNVFPIELTSTQRWKSNFNVKFAGNHDFAASDVLVKYHAMPESLDNGVYTINVDVKYALKTNDTIGAEVVVKEDVKFIYQATTRQLLSVKGRARDPRGWYQTYTLTPCASQAS